MSPEVAEVSPDYLDRLDEMFEEIERAAARKVVRRFMAKVSPEPNTGCWLWAGGGGQYGSFSINGEPMGAHRAAYILAIGEIPDGMCVMHKCDVAGCVNPAHLMVGTHADNMADSCAKGRRYRGALHAAALAALARIHSDSCGSTCCAECRDLSRTLEVSR